MEQERREKRVQELIAIWDKEILPNWDQVKRTKRVRELWIEGLPPQVRGRVWYYAFGNRNSITKDLYYLKSD
jgi:TBC1 domain family member 12